MLAQSTDHLPAPAPKRELRYEPKWDGFRCLAFRADGGQVRLQSRQLRPLDAAFPEVVKAVAATVPPGTILDGEIVRWHDGRLDFDALQRRNTGPRRNAELARREPCHLIVWDVLETGGTALLSRPLSERRLVLAEVLADAPPAGLVVLCPQIGDVGEARLWAEVLAPQGVEGMVAKSASGAYRPGRRGWWKWKRRRTTEAIVGGITGTLARPGALILGRMDAEGELHVVGRTVPVTAPARERIARLLRPPAGPHPWPPRLPVGWRGGTAEYVQVEPELVVEVEVDAAVWRHPARIVRPRPDLTIEDVARGRAIDD
ncbi:ATP-dependent DNA ligase [Actinomadura gamaensis]|uniref:ATP-dependent DNA ligase n=1 Tax=Actinomadura gamaensis TaxID=1763541 RepID=A0ABV9U113_9ACTN